MRHMRFTIHLVQAGGDRGSPGGRRRRGGQRGGGSRANRASGLGAWEAGAREAARLFPLPRTPCSCAPWLQGGEEACEAGACALGCGRCPPSLARWRGEEARAPLFYFFSRVTGGRSSLPPLSHFVLAARRESGACSGEKREVRRAARLSVPSSITAIMSSHHPHPRRAVRGDGAGVLVPAGRGAHLFTTAPAFCLCWRRLRRPARPTAGIGTSGGGCPDSGGGRHVGWAR